MRGALFFPSFLALFAGAARPEGAGVAPNVLGPSKAGRERCATFFVFLPCLQGQLDLKVLEWRQMC